MEYLINKKYLPTSFSVGFLEEDYQRVADAFYKWQKKLGHSVKSQDVKNASLDSLNRLFPLSFTKRLIPFSFTNRVFPLSFTKTKDIFISTDSSWTACFDNDELGPEISTLICYLSFQLNCRGLEVSCIPNEYDVQTGSKSEIRHFYNALQFVYYDPSRASFPDCVRSIDLINDGGKNGTWEFQQYGIPEDFERPEMYDNKEIKDRFTPELLKIYCSKLGIQLFDNDFYGPHAILVETKIKTLSDKKLKSLFSKK